MGRVSNHYRQRGSGWYFNLTNDVLVGAGYHDAREVREKFRLHQILKDYNCNIGDATLIKFLRLFVPHCLGYSFAVKTHQRPSRRLLHCLCSVGILKITYIFRDPRDVAVSAFEHGKRIRASGQMHSFATLDNIESSILFTRKLLKAWDEWVQCKVDLGESVLLVRYEDMITNIHKEMVRLAEFLNIKLGQREFEKIIGKYSRLSASDNPKGLHFNRGLVGRFREVMNADQLSFCEKQFGPYLKMMHYQF